MILERATRKRGSRRLEAVHGRSFLGLVRRQDDQEWRSADGQVSQIRISTATADGILADAVAKLGYPALARWSSRRRPSTKGRSR